MDNAWYKECSTGRRFLLKISPGEKLVEKLLNFAEETGVKNAVISSAIGSVTGVRIRGIKAGAKLPITAPRMNIYELDGPFEMLDLEGNIVPNDKGESDCHLHILISKSTGEVLGGHLFDARVFASCEIMIEEFFVTGVVERHQSKSGGISTFYLGDKDE
ncbi:MAG: hypothetical protein B6I37_04255 [Desulfobacteraceae bacterium 4572_35.2]|nr:MAG: hypothetical protein B6I37_04255 [Desulfobacteraceae bacterium 4572_35.2]